MREKGWKTSRETARGDSKQKMLCTGLRNETIRIWDLVLNSGTWSQSSQYDWLWPPNISHTASHVSSEPERWCMLSLKGAYTCTQTLSEDCCIRYVTSLGAATLFTSVLEEFIAFLYCRYKNSHYFWTRPLWECMPDPYTICLLIIAILHELMHFWGQLLATWNHTKLPIQFEQCIYSSQPCKTNREKHDERQTNTQPIMAPIGHSCITQCASYKNVSNQSNHRYG